MLIHTVATLPCTTGDPKDSVQMGLTFSKGAAATVPTAADGSTVNGFMNHFLLDNAANGDLANTYNLGRILSYDVVRTAALVLVEAYDVHGGGSPIAIDNPPGDLGAGDGSAPQRNLPRQAAIVISMHGDLTGVPEELPGPPPSRPKARKRGRVYVGPLNRLTLGDFSPSRVDPTVTHFLGELLKGVRATASAAGWDLVVYSRKDLVNPVSVVTSITVDNRFDTQRRRAPKATARYVAL